MIGELFLLAYRLFYGTVMLGFMAMAAGCVSMWLVDFPCCLIEPIIKKKIPTGIKNKLRIAFTIILTLYFASKTSLDTFV